MEDYIVTGKLLYIFINYPLSFHAQAQLAAEAAECAGLQGQFWKMHDQLYLNQAEWSDNDGALNIFLGYGRKLDLDQTAFQTCMGNHEMASKVQSDYAFGQSIQVPATPSFVINGKGMSGGQPYSTFQQVIDAALNAQP
jgi:protein-disulfide isomerase